MAVASSFFVNARGIEADWNKPQRDRRKCVFFNASKMRVA